MDFFTTYCGVFSELSELFQISEQKRLKQHFMKNSDYTRRFRIESSFGRDVDVFLSRMFQDFRI